MLSANADADSFALSFSLRDSANRAF